MNINGKHYRTIWVKDSDPNVIQIIDQRSLPHRFILEDLTTVEQVVTAIKDMHVRGAGLIGATAGYGMYLAALKAPAERFDEYLNDSASKLIESRPTAVNLSWAVNMQLEEIKKGNIMVEKIGIAF